MKSSRYANSHATSYREGWNWRTSALCRDDPGRLDGDRWREDGERPEMLAARCRDSCPVLAECAEFTGELVAAGTPPKDMVQAGLIWNHAGKPSSRVDRKPRQTKAKEAT